MFILNYLLINFFAFNLMYWLLIQLSMALFVGLIFNKIYLWHALKKVDAICDDHARLSSEQLLDIMKKYNEKKSNLWLILIFLMSICFGIYILFNFISLVTGKRMGKANNLLVGLSLSACGEPALQKSMLSVFEFEEFDLYSHDLNECSFYFTDSSTCNVQMFSNLRGLGEVKSNDLTWIGTVYDDYTDSLFFAPVINFTTYRYKTEVDHQTYQFVFSIPSNISKKQKDFCLDHKEKLLKAIKLK